jgi:hypothetical protein
MEKINWEGIKFRASSWGDLLAEPRSAEDKKAGKLGKTCIAELIKIYNQEVYGRKKDITTKQMEKGKLAEEDGIKLFSMVENIEFFKNPFELENDFFKGTPDIFIGESIRKAEKVYDNKNCWELDSFMPKLVEEPDRSHVAQVNVYYDLTGAQGGGIAYTLVDCPPQILMEEKRRLMYSMNVIDESVSPEYLRAAAELEFLLTFSDIDYRERVIKKEVPRDNELIATMKAKVPVFRQFLEEFHYKHMKQYPK